MYQVAKVTPIVLDIVDVAPGLKYIALIARFYATGESAHPDEEVVYRRGQFRGKYVVGSSLAAIAGGYRLTITREGGWPSNVQGVVGHIVFALDVLDSAGNLG